MAEIVVSQILALLTEVGQRYQQPATLLLLGGSALRLLGSPRPTLDIDYVGHDLHKNTLQQVLEQVAQEMGLEVEAVRLMSLCHCPGMHNSASCRLALMAFLPSTFLIPILLPSVN